MIVDAFNGLRPENVVFVISIGKNKKPSGMVAAWFTKCSWDPPMIAVALSKEGYTHKLIRESKEFVVAVPNKGLEKDLMLFGTTHGDVVDKFKETGIKTKKAKYVKSPLIEDATINFECVLEKEVDVGDHILFVGKVLESHMTEGKGILLSMKRINGKRTFEEF